MVCDLYLEKKERKMEVEIMGVFVKKKNLKGHTTKLQTVITSAEHGLHISALSGRGCITWVIKKNKNIKNTTE